MDLLTLAQSVPGPIAINTSVFVGYKMRGLKGAVAALLGSVLPSFVIILAIALMFADIRHNPVVDAAFKGMRPAVVALIVVPVFSLARGMHWSMFFVIAAAALLLMFPHSKAPDEQNFIDGWSWALFGGVFISSVKKVNPILLIALSAAAGILIYYVF